MKYDRITYFIAFSVHEGMLTLSLRPSDMKKGQSMVKYTFLFIKFLLPEFVSYLIGEIGVLCLGNG